MSEDRDESRPQVIQKWVGIVGVFVAPTTVITALCLYFGYVFTRTFFADFGIDVDAIGFTTSDYVLKSVSVLYAPIIVLLLAWIALLWAGEHTRRLANDGRRTHLIRRVAWIAMAIGGLAAASGFVGVVRPWALPESLGWLTPLALGMGTLLGVVGVWMMATSRTDSAPRAYAGAERASMAAAVAVIVLALFWITNVYATAYGRNQAETTAAKLWSRETAVVLDTTNRLVVPHDLIEESLLPSPDPAHKEGSSFRYECFRVLAVRGDRWVLVPARWTPDYGYALIVNADSANRISVNRYKGIADTQAADWAGDWRCPEVAPPERLAAPNK
jgi:hypothetical protein